MDICNSLPSQNLEDTVSEQDFKEAIETMNRGKSAYINGVTVEHFLYSGNALRQKANAIINSVFSLGRSQRPLR